MNANILSFPEPYTLVELLLKALVDSEIVDAFKHGLKVLLNNPP